MLRIFEFAKPLIVAFIIIALLQVTGLFGDVAAITQHAALSTGLMNASIPMADKNQENFDFGFTLKDSLGNRFNADQFKGKVIFLNVWATWCGPCRAEMPAIHKLYNKVKDDRIIFIMLSIDKDHAAQKVQAYVRKNKYTFPVYMPSGYLTEQLNVPSIPTTFVISKEGKIVMKEVGTKNYNTNKFMKFLNELAAK
jgi:thiol-disulfide isomerase/thioredoxin